MTVAPHDIDPARFLQDHLAEASPDLLRQMLSTFINSLLSADADPGLRRLLMALTQPGNLGEPRRNGYRHRDFDTRSGTLDVAIPKLRQGSYFPGVAAGAAPPGGGRTHHGLSRPTTCLVSRPGGWRDLVQTLGVTGLSKSQVSEMARRPRRARSSSSARGRWTPARTRSSLRTR